MLGQVKWAESRSLTWAVGCVLLTAIRKPTQSLDTAARGCSCALALTLRQNPTSLRGGKGCVQAADAYNGTLGFVCP